MSEIRKQKKIKGRSLPGLLPVQPSQLAGPASRRPSPPPSSVVFVLDRGRGVRPARARHRATPPARLPAWPPLLARCPGQRHASPLLSLTLPRFFPSSPSLSLSRPNTTIAAVRHSSRHRPPLAPPTSSGAPPRPPLPPHRSTGLRKPCIAAHVAVPLLGHRRSSPSIRCTPAVPEPANHPCSSAVSH